MKLLIHASGYKSPFISEQQEIACGKQMEIGGNPKCVWSPHNADFEKVGRSSGGSTPAASIEELVDIIEKQKIGSIDELRILGHSSSDFFALAGTVVTDSERVLIRFKEDSMIGQTKTFLSFESRLHALRNRFSEKGSVTLAGCGSGGVGSGLLALASRAFLCCVSGFERPIQYGLNATFPPTSRRIDRTWHISERGRLSYDLAMHRTEELLGASAVNVMALQTNAWGLMPDARSCVGQSILNAAGRANRSPIDGSLSSFEIGWRILNEFFPEKVGRIAGVGSDDTLSGLRVEIEKAKVTIVVGKPYALNTRPETIDQRVEEMRQALELVATQTSGTVQMK